MGRGIYGLLQSGGRGGQGPVSCFLYAARSVILVISAQAAVTAGLLAADAGRFALPEFLGVLIGFVVAHMISNLSNDYFGLKRGHDTPDSPRMRYTIHPLASGVLDSRTLVTGLAILGAVGVAIAVALIVERGWPAAAFAGAGSPFSSSTTPRRSRSKASASANSPRSSSGAR